MVGLYARVVIPTGNAPHGKWLFEPMVGNGRHWELGMGVNGSALLWQNEAEGKHCGFYGDMTLTHLFATKQNRVFDLKHKPLSRYMLAGKMVGGNTEKMAPIANITASRVDVKINAQADLALWLNYTHKNVTTDLGYNFWARSCEKVSCPKTKCSSCCPTILATEADWGVMNSPGITSSDATINSLGHTDDPNVFLTTADLDLRGGATRSMTHSFFWHVAYNWFDKITIPYIGLGGSVECARSNGCRPTSSCDTAYHAQSCQSCCRTIALSQWTLWLKGGCAF